MALKHAVLLSCCVLLESRRVNIFAVFMFDCGLVMNFFIYPLVNLSLVSNCQTVYYLANIVLFICSLCKCS